MIRQHLDLGGFTRPFAAFKRDEAANDMTLPRYGFFGALRHASQLLDAGAQQADCKLADAVERAACHRAGADRLAGMHRHLQCKIAVAPEPESAYTLIVLHRRADWAGVDDPRDQLVIAVLLHHHADRFVGMQRTRPSLAAKHLAVSDRLARLEKDT